MTRHRILWPALIATGFVAALAAELFVVSVLPRRSYGLPIGISELGALGYRVIFVSGPFALLLLLAAMARSQAGRRLWASLGIAVALANMFLVYDIWAEVEDPAAASLGGGAVLLLEWLIAIGCMVVVALHAPAVRGRSQ